MLRIFILILIFNFLFQFTSCKENNSKKFPAPWMLVLIGEKPNKKSNNSSSSTLVLTSGSSIDLNDDNNGDGILLDINKDGVLDGIDLTGNGFINLPLIDSNRDGKPDGIDINNDGIIDYYLNLQSPFLTTGPNGTGNKVQVIDSDKDGNWDGFDTDGDGTANNQILRDIFNDKEIPLITINPDEGVYSTSQLVNLTCSDSIGVAGILYTIDSQTPSYKPFVGNFSLGKMKSISLTAQGSYQIKANCIDLNGNISFTISKTFTIDSNLPSVSILNQSSTAVSINSGAINSSTIQWSSNKSGTYTIREGGNNCNEGLVIETNTTTGNNHNFIRNANHFTGEGIWSYRICVVSSTGLTGSTTFQLTRDDTAPTVIPNPDTGSYGMVVNPTLECSDAGSGCDKIVYIIQQGTNPTDPVILGSTGAIQSGTLYIGAISTIDQQINYLKYRARDKAGNVSSVVSKTYTIDSNLPMITINSTDPSILYVNGTMNFSVQFQSNRTGTYRIKKNSCTNPSTIQTGTIHTINSPINATILNSAFTVGTNSIKICVENLIGNFGEASLEIIKDNASPSITISPSTEGPHISGTNLNLVCQDESGAVGVSGSGCKKIIYTLNGSDPSFTGSFPNTCQTVNGTEFSTSPILPNGTYTIKARACDILGNVSSINSQSVSIGPPSVPSISASAGNGKVNISFSLIPNVTNYKLYYSTSSGVNTSNSFVTGTSSPIEVTGLTNGTNYYFAMSSSHGGGESSLSSEISSTPIVGKKIFITATSYRGDLGGFSGADAKCNSDSNKPSGGGTYKAILGGNPGNPALKPNQIYLRADGVTVIGTTNSSAVFNTPLTNPLVNTWGQPEIWNGAGGSHCDNWAASGLVTGGTIIPTSLSGWTHSSTIALCLNSRKFSCAEQ